MTNINRRFIKTVACDMAKQGVGGCKCNCCRVPRRDVIRATRRALRDEARREIYNLNSN